MERYVIDMDDEGGHIYYLTKDKGLFEAAQECSEDEDLWQLLEDYKKDFEQVYDLKGITVIDIVTGYFY